MLPYGYLVGNIIYEDKSPVNINYDIDDGYRCNVTNSDITVSADDGSAIYTSNVSDSPLDNCATMHVFKSDADDNPEYLLICNGKSYKIKDKTIDSVVTDTGTRRARLYGSKANIKNILIKE